MCEDYVLKKQDRSLVSSVLKSYVDIIKDKTQCLNQVPALLPASDTINEITNRILSLSGEIELSPIKRPFRVFLISGMPNSGKTAWTAHYRNHYPTTLRFCLDSFFKNPKYQKVVGPISNIHKHCVNRGFKKDLYFQVVASAIEDSLSKHTGLRDVLIEGFSLQFIRQDIIKFLKDCGCDEFIKLDFSNYSFNYSGQLINFKAAHKKGIAKACRRSFMQMAQIDFNQIKKKIDYQSFPQFSHIGDSDSPQKLQQSKLELKENDSFLDIGCNTGYFCFEAAKQTSGRILGIDGNAGPINAAIKLNKNIFKKQNIEFKVCRAFSFSGETFDVIFCASTFHYFKEQQKHFFELLHSLLNNEGIALIEIETLPNNQDSPQWSTGNKLKVHYPNQKWIEKMSEPFLEIVDVYDSIEQPGSEYPRLFYKFKKK